MNILITLPKYLIEKIISREKRFEMRKVLPKHVKIGEDGFYVVEKGTSHVRCWCRIDEVLETEINYFSAKCYAHRLCVSEDYIYKYAKGKKVSMWKIGKVIAFAYLDRSSLMVDKNPQQFAYTPLSYGESF